jgi:threonylcarbamoyladenosine tRNA methylthiotransferase CDKAL1
MRIYVKGFGCSSSLADAEVLAGCLSSAGHMIVNNLQNAELVLYNTCAVKTPTENRMIHLLKNIPKEKRLIVAGCLPLINFERLCKEVCFDGVVGPAFGEKIVDVVAQVSKGTHVARLEATPVRMPRLDLPRIHVNPRISVIPISYGCGGSCTYCCVRFARGKLRSYGIKAVVSKVAKDFADGVREFWLTSQDTACYGKDIGTNLVELLGSVCTVEGDFFIRVGMMTLNNLVDVLDELVEAFQNEKVFKFLHLPVQSGDDDILRRMNRFYSAKDFVMVVGRFKKAFPQSTVATDVIVGFPGETEEAFGHTWDLIEDVQPDIVNVSKFFARPGTLATKLRPQVSPLEVKRRSARLAGLVRHIAFERNSSWDGWSGRILVDEVGRSGSVVGRNFAYKPIVIRHNGSGLLGQFVCVKIVDAFQSHLLGETV